jgi:hypothetical protein
VPEQAADAVRALEALHEVGGIERHARTVGEEPDRATSARRPLTDLTIRQILP